MSLPQDNTLGPWIIDDRSHYEQPAGGHQKPLQLGAVVAEIPTAFDSIVIRDPGTIGKPCPSKEELDRLGSERAALFLAAPDLLEACREALLWYGPDGDHISDPARGLLLAAIAKARPT